MRIAAARRVTNGLVRALAWAAVCVALFPLADMVALAFRRAVVPSIRLALAGAAPAASGLGAAAAGSVLLLGMAAAAAVPLGVVGGAFVAGRPTGLFSRCVRRGADLLAGLPGVAAGYFGYVLLVRAFGWGHSLPAGSAVLALLMLPHVVRATDGAVSAVAEDVREVSLALGVDHGATVGRVVLQAALPGILAGILVAAVVAFGETAALIYTAGRSPLLAAGRAAQAPAAYLTGLVWTDIGRSSAGAHGAAYAAALLLMLAATLLTTARRWICRGRAMGAGEG